MLVCPQCQFENPNANKFCQKCGTSLTHKTCHQCDSQVALSAENCQNCGTFTATVWWAILSKEAGWQFNLTAEQATLPVDNQSTFVQGEASSPAEMETPIPLGVSGLRPVQASPEVEGKPDAVRASVSDDSAEANPLLVQANAAPEVAPETAASLVSLSENTDPSSITSSSVVDNQDSAAPNSSDVVYLDTQLRYQLLEPLPSKETMPTEVQIRVLDTQPFQKSPLAILAEQESQEHEFVEPTTAISSSEPAVSSLSASKDDLAAIAIPSIARSYLDLQAKFYPAVPTIHDAWSEDGTSVVLLEDRSEWLQLTELWSGESIPPLQILYWLDEMVKLWVAFTPWQCRQSLLEVSNLRVDEDQAMSLRRLYPESPNAPVKLQDLGRLWQILFSHSQQTQFIPLHALLGDLRDGNIENPDDLRRRLEVIAQEIEPTPPYPSAEVDRTASEVPSKPQPSVLGSDNSEGDGDPTIILPMQLLSLDDAGCTDIGRQRNHNEDFFGMQTRVKKQENALGRTVHASGLYILCDGMGGHAGGEVASAMAVDSLKNYFQANWQFKELPDEATIREGVRLANKAIYDVNQQNSRSGSGRMGTTLVLVLIQDTKVAIAHVGDSRLYRLSRKRGLEQVTVDHEVGQREIQRGIEPSLAYSRPDAYQLTQALGPRDEHYVNPDVQFIELNEDTLLILCSDGLSDNDLLETHWQTHLLPLVSSRANLDLGVSQLIDLANQHNGHDNITAVVIRAKVRPNLDQQRWA